jgi:proline dehydrogenase
MARRFVAGETIPEAIAAAKRLNEKGLKATLDCLGEDCRNTEDAKRSCDEYCALLASIAESQVDSNVSLKLSQLGLGFDEGLARSLLETILLEAAKFHNFVRIDMEGSDFTQKTIDLFKDVFARHKNVGIVIQAYLRRSRKDIEDMISLGARVRLCKGAYKEPSSIAFPDKETVNRNYDELARLLLKAPLPAFATHDDERILNAERAAEASGLGKDQYEIQMLYGLRAKRWEELHAAGHAVRIYIPYGSHWIPYFYRRLRERKENVAFVLKSLFR